MRVGEIKQGIHTVITTLFVLGASTKAGVTLPASSGAWSDMQTALGKQGLAAEAEAVIGRDQQP